MILPSKRVICIFFALAVVIQMGYYFEFLEFREPPMDLFEFRHSPTPSSEPFLAPLHTFCNKTKPHSDVYINCSSISLPAFDAINQLQVCIRWAMDAGVGIIKPTFVTNEDINGTTPSRTDIEFLLDEAFLWQALGANCPWLKVVELSELGDDFVELDGDPFFDGKLYRKGSYSRYLQVRLHEENLPAGTTVIFREDGSFCGWERRRDPAPVQLAFKHLFRFSRPLATISGRIISNMPRSFFGVHLTIGDESAKEELVEELLDAVLSRNTSADPVVYVGCDDARALTEFTQRAQERGVITTHKWAAAKDVDAEWMTKTLTVEQLKVVDHMVMQRAQYVFGSAGTIDAFMLGMERHVIQFGNLEYHGVDRQQHLFGSSSVNLWDGNSW